MGRAILLALISFGLGLSEIAWAAGPVAKSRREFAQAMSKVKEGMTEAEVIALLGKPDDRHTQIDWGSMFFNARKMLRYGAAGHWRAATLGQVCFDQGNKVSYVSGKGTPPPEGLFTEPELRNLLEALFALPSYNASSKYNPRPVIRAVNLLQPLGKEKALAAIDEFLRVSFAYTDPGQEGIMLLLRTLFDVPDKATVFPYDMPSTPGYMPRMMVGAPFPHEPKDKKLIPRFPVTIEGDIPFLLVEGYRLGGEAEPPSSHVRYFRKFGKLRAHPLVPTARPLEALEAFEKFYGTEPVLLRNQVLNLLETVYSTDIDEPASSYSDRQVAEQEKSIAEASKLAIRWNAEEFKYTFLDGTSLPAVDPDRYRPWSWRPAVAGLNTELTIKRKSRRYVDVVCREDYEVARQIDTGIEIFIRQRGATPSGPSRVIRLYAVQAKDLPLFQFTIGERADTQRNGVNVGYEAGTSRARVAYYTVRLDEQAELKAELIVDGKVIAQSPVFKP